MVAGEGAVSGCQPVDGPNRAALMSGSGEALGHQEAEALGVSLLLDMTNSPSVICSK